MTNEQIIREAISRSISHDEIVHVEVNRAGDTHDTIWDAVSSSVSQDWDYSEENRDEEGREVLDVYSLEETADQWRVKVTII